MKRAADHWDDQRIHDYGGLYITIEMKRAADHWNEQRVRDYGVLYSMIEMKRAADHWDEEGSDYGGMYGLR
jgi:hypothetical protein